MANDEVTVVDTPTEIAEVPVVGTSEHEAIMVESVDVTRAQTLAEVLTTTAQQYDAAQLAEKRTEGVDVEGVFDGPYDPIKAMQAITRLNRECEAAEKEYLASKEQTSGFKKTLESRQHSLNRLIRQYDQRSRDEQPYLQPVTDVNGQPSAPACPFERETGQPCVICRGRKPTDTAPLQDAPAHPQHVEHLDAARQAALQKLMFALLGRQCFLEIEMLERLTDTERADLSAWAESTKRGPVIPTVLATSHVAAAAGEREQHCRRCGTVLKRADENGVFYVEGSYVGLECQGDDQQRDDATTARTLPKRGAKKSRSKPDHDAERQAQKAEGKKRATKKARA